MAAEEDELGTYRSLVSAGRFHFNRGDRCGVCPIQRSRIRAQTGAGGKLEQRLVSAIRICGYQLHKELGLRGFRCGRIVDWRVSLAHFPARYREEQSHAVRLVR
jgi:hypothetical protein